ncbi:MAG: hypothetical protein WC783_00215 [Candidatus Paceibacterota bacterium]|jgi:hypothetical protein
MKSNILARYPEYPECRQCHNYIEDDDHYDSVEKDYYIKCKLCKEPLNNRTMEICFYLHHEDDILKELEGYTNEMLIEGGQLWHSHNKYYDKGFFIKYTNPQLNITEGYLFKEIFFEQWENENDKVFIRDHQLLIRVLKIFYEYLGEWKI